jgi:hypothetical protein
MDGYTIMNSLKIAAIEEKKQALYKSLIRDNGVVFSFDKSRLEKLGDYLHELPKSFPDLSKYGLLSRCAEAGLALERLPY